MIKIIERIYYLPEQLSLDGGIPLTLVDFHSTIRRLKKYSEYELASKEGMYLISGGNVITDRTASAWIRVCHTQMKGLDQLCRKIGLPIK